MTLLAIHRPAKIRNSATKYIVEIDGDDVGVLGSNSTFTAELKEGLHELKIRIQSSTGSKVGYMGCETYDIDTADGETVSLEVIPLPVATTRTGPRAAPDQWLAILPSIDGKMPRLTRTSRDYAVILLRVVGIGALATTWFVFKVGSPGWITADIVVVSVVIILIYTRFVGRRR
jgi:hypothetical protein